MAPEDVFAYCTATPAHIMGQVSADEALTVGAARTDQPSYAQLDTPGAGRAHTGGGTVDASAARYRGIRNYVSEHDVIPMLPPTAWGLVRYGVVVDPGEGKVGLDDMAQDLKAISETYYAQFMAGADPRRLCWSILDATRLDLDNLKLDASVMLPTPHLRRQGLQGPARKTRPGLSTVAPTSVAYVTGEYQALLQALSLAILSGSLGDVSTIMSRPGSAELLKSVLFGHLAYARERLGAASDTEAATVFVIQLVSQLTGKDASSIVTVNDLVVALSDLIDDNASSPFVESLLGRAATTLAKNPPAETIKTVLSLYHPQDAQAGTPVVAQSELFQGERMRALSEVVSCLIDSLVPGVPSGTRGAGLSLAAASEQDLEAQLKTHLLDFLRALSKGAAPTSTMGITGGTAQTARTLPYGAITLVLGDDSVYGAIDGGNGQVTPLVAALLPYLMRYTEGGTQRTYESFAAAADGNFRQAALALMPSDPATAETLSALGPQLTILLNATLFSASEAPYDLGYNVCILSRVLTSTDAIVLAHRPQTYVAFARAANRLYETNHSTTPVTPEDHTDTQVRPVPSEPGKGTRDRSDRDYYP